MKKSNQEKQNRKATVKEIERQPNNQQSVMKIKKKQICKGEVMRTKSTKNKSDTVRASKIF